MPPHLELFKEFNCRRYLKRISQQSKKSTSLFTVDKKRKHYGKIFKKQENKIWEYVMGVQ